jgi:hypothetical protein
MWFRAFRALVFAGVISGSDRNQTTKQEHEKEWDRFKILIRFYPPDPPNPSSKKCMHRPCLARMDFLSVYFLWSVVRFFSLASCYFVCSWFGFSVCAYSPGYDPKGKPRITQNTRSTRNKKTREAMRPPLVSRFVVQKNERT